MTVGVFLDAFDVFIDPVGLPELERKLNDLGLLTFSSKVRMACTMSFKSLAARTTGLLSRFMEVTMLLMSYFPWRESLSTFSAVVSVEVEKFSIDKD
ncbi:hypothetical protein MSP8886_02783 [Marinomonas spartinae]|uniref:Uncharacterized protein n=1 Tax=Marinomonas spartinae TaxID=1792290 RepID=A0A1A8TKN8_9GAMM|nr:hypothetical protein [Marinomonas spartinae]SBS33532.1 hypothetical protein MSP8886_02783 [Marinomonas spartinae]